MSIGSFYKKKTLTKGIDKANQVLKWQKALAAIEEATKKQAANKIGSLDIHCIPVLIHFLLFSGIGYCWLFIIRLMVEVVQLRILFSLLHMVKAINCSIFKLNLLLV